MHTSDRTGTVPGSESAKLTVPNDMSYLPIVQTCVRAVAGKFGFEGDCLGQLELGVEEAVSNVIEHAFEAGERSSFDVICQRVPMGIKIVIKDKGLPFDPCRLPEYRPAATLDEVASSGMGVYLMRQLMDSVSFHNLGPEGKETHLVKYLPGRSVADEGRAPDEPAQARREPEVIKEKLNYSVRRMEPAEAIEISRCAYKSHGYTFFDEHIYYPDRIVELNRFGKMISAVAVTEGGVFMGHAALVYPYDGAEIAELTFVFVNVEYRGQGCMNRLCEFLFTLPLERKLSGVYAYAVANHVMTQKVMARYGFHDCGILLATSPETWHFKGISDDRSQRISVVLSYKYLEPPKPRTIYAPAEHAAMIERLYRILGAEHRCEVPLPDLVDLEPEQSVIDAEIYASENCGEIHVVRCGSDVVKEVRRTLRDLCLKHVAMITLLVSLDNPVTAAMTPEFQKMGFFFAGILPCHKVGDALILQYLNNVPFDYGKVLTHTDVAKELLEYIRRHDPNVA